ncbi:MAG: cadherin repeat domain-containing protein [Bacteroidales bacterium]|nr:cadherin repeat domain-containing protein [Bacteroidales bacterium]
MKSLLLHFQINIIFISINCYSQTINYDGFVNVPLSFAIPKSEGSAYILLNNKPQNAQFDTITGFFKWIPESSDIGYHSFNYTVFTENNQQKETGRFSMYISDKKINTPPTIDLQKCIHNNKSCYINNTGNIVINESDTLILIFKITDNDDVFTSYYFNNDLNNKNIENVSVILENDYKTIQLTCIPKQINADSKQINFYIITRDSNGSTVKLIQKINILDINFPPFISNKPLQVKYLYDDLKYVYQPIVENDDSNELIWQLVCDEKLHEFIEFNNKTGEIALVVKKSKIIEDTLSYRLKLMVKEVDEQLFADSVELLYKWKKSNVAPVIRDFYVWEIKEGIPATYQVIADDSNVSDKITYSIHSSNIKGIKINETSGLIELNADYELVAPYEKNKEFVVTVNATDSKGLFDSKKLTIKIFDRYNPSSISSKYTTYKENFSRTKNVLR